ncbi:hypothetical protein SKAU_G00262630 [Synaphobranchus kaupii]|uniref:Uncharacterized protein n=1 Tax=Synaphobranchus kaupii TaxID=118154 RepID=A0A9Q1EYY9_SYNKA|nr:hypothetical protein SKAU_G00262630 [Synaphobranchus kaupii]
MLGACKEGAVSERDTATAVDALRPVQPLTAPPSKGSSVTWCFEHRAPSPSSVACDATKDEVALGEMGGGGAWLSDTSLSRCPVLGMRDRA